MTKCLRNVKSVIIFHKHKFSHWLHTESKLCYTEHNILKSNHFWGVSCTKNIFFKSSKNRRLNWSCKCTLQHLQLHMSDMLSTWFPCSQSVYMYIEYSWPELKQWRAQPQINVQCACKLCKPGATIHSVTASAVGPPLHSWPMLQ